MNESTILLTLASIHFIALMSPGPDFALVVQNATRHGRQTGLYIALGLSVGILLHSLFSLTGVSYLVHQHPLLYSVLQLLGGSYLLYLGVGALRSVIATIKKPKTDQQNKTNSFVISNKRQAFAKGFATNILNPKALVFFISLMSSLVPAGMSVSGKSIALVILFSLSLVWFSSLAWDALNATFTTSITTGRHLHRWHLWCGVYPRWRQYLGANHQHINRLTL